MIGSQREEMLFKHQKMECWMTLRENTWICTMSSQPREPIHPTHFQGCQSLARPLHSATVYQASFAAYRHISPQRDTTIQLCHPQISPCN